MQIEHKKNTAYYLAFPMIDSSTPASFGTGLTVSDTGYYKDGAGAWTSLSITDTVSEIGSTGVYEIDLTAAELNHDYVIIKFTASGAADTAFMFNMRTQSVDDLNVTASGNIGIDWANVENPTTAVDLSATDIQLCDTITTYTGNTVQTGDAFARLGAPAGASVSADVAAVKAETVLIVADTNELQTDWTDGGRLDLILDAILLDTGTTIPGTITTMQGNVTDILADTNELQTDWTNGGRLDLIIDEILVDTGTTLPASIAALNDISAADVNAQVVDVIRTDTASELAAVPAASPALHTMIQWVYQIHRNKLTSTATASTVSNDAGTTIGTSTDSDDATTFTRGEFA